MGALTKFQLIIGNLQFIGMLRAINIPFPSIYLNFSSFSDLVSIDPTFVQSINSNIPVLTFRLLFIAVAILFPCMLMVFTTLVFVNFPTIQWAAYSLISLFLVTMLIVIKQTPSYAVITLDVTSSYFLYTTIASAAYCVIFKLISYVFSKQKGSIVRYFVKQLLTPGMLFAGSSLARFSNFTIRVVFCICMLMLFSFSYKAPINRAYKFLSLMLFAGAGVWFFIRGATTLDAVNDFPKALMIPGYILIVLSGLGWIQFLLRSNDDKSFGRFFVRARKKIQTLLDKGLLAVSFFFLSSAFVPVVTFAAQNWVCRIYECAAGFKFNPYVPSASLVKFNGTSTCDPCSFNSSVCPFASADLCPAFKDNRLAFYPETRCDDPGAIFFKLASILVVFVFVPLNYFMYYKVISVITSTLLQIAPKVLQDLQADFEKIKEKREARERERFLDSMMLEGADDVDDPFAARAAGSAFLGNTTHTSNDPQQRDSSGSRMDALGSPLLRMPLAEADDDPFSFAYPASPGGAPRGRSRQDTSLRDAHEMVPLGVSVQGGSMAGSFPPPLPPPLPPGSADRFGSSQRAADATPPPTRLRSKSAIHKLEDSLKPPTMEDAVATASTRIVTRASCLYSEFRRGEYYFIFAVMTHRLCLVGINVFVAPFSGYAAPANLAVNGLMCLVQTVRRPFQHAVEQTLSFIVLFAMVLNSLYATLLWQNPESGVLTSNEMAIALVVVTGGIPLVCACGMQIFSVLETFRNPYAKVEKQKKKEELEQRKEKENDLKNEITTCQFFEEFDKVEALKEQLALLQVRQATYEEKMTDALDDRTKRIILYFFVAAVPMLLAGLGLALWATVNAEAALFAEGSSLVDRSASLVLAGRRSWSDLTATCCAVAAILPMTGFNLTERWVFSNWTSAAAVAAVLGNTTSLPGIGPLLSLPAHSSMTVSRNRQAVVISDGLPIRNMTSTTFNGLFARCNVTLDAEDGDAVAFVCHGDAKQTTDAFALTVLW